MSPELNLMTQTDRAAIEGQIISVKEDISDIKGSMGKVADALTVLAVLGEKHQTVAETTNRILSRIEKMEERQIIMDKREFALTELTRRLDSSEGKIEEGEDRLKTLEDDKNTQNGQIKGMTSTVKLIWAVLAGSGLTMALVGLFV